MIQAITGAGTAIQTMAATVQVQVNSSAQIGRTVDVGLQNKGVGVVKGAGLKGTLTDIMS